MASYYEDLERSGTLAVPHIFIHASRTTELYLASYVKRVGDSEVLIPLVTIASNVDDGQEVGTHVSAVTNRERITLPVHTRLVTGTLRAFHTTITESLCSAIGG